MTIRSIPIRDQLVRFRIKELKNANINVMVPQNASVGESVDVAVYFLDSDATGYVNISVGTEFNESYAIESGSVRTTITGLTAGTKPVTVRYLGDSNYKQATLTTSLSIVKPIISNFMSSWAKKTYPSTYQTMTEVPSEGIQYLNSIRPDRIVSLLDGCKKLTTIDLTNLDTSEVTNMRYVFYQCNALTSLDLSTWDTSKVTFMENLFYYCTNLRALDLTGWDTSSVVASDAMEMMFTKCDNLQYLILGDATKIFNMIDANCGRLNTTCKILVPQSVLSTYTSATNWSTIASQFEAIENYVITRTDGGVSVSLPPPHNESIY